jgi:hypothetical protein
MATTPQARAVPRYKLGTNRIPQHHPTLTNINRHLRRPPVVPTGEALARVLSAALHQQTQRSPHPKQALAGRAGLRGGQHSVKPGTGREGWVWHPINLPRATTRRPGGKPGRLAYGWEGCLPPGHRVVGLRSLSTGCPTTPSAQDHLWSSGRERHHDLWHAAASTYELTRDGTVTNAHQSAATHGPT